MKPRDYQIDAVRAVFDYFESNTGNPILYVAGGGGKSVIIALLIETILKQFNNQRIIVSASSQDLVGQNYSKLASMMPNAHMGLYSAGLGKKQPWYNVVYGGIQSMYSKSHQLGYRDLLLIDECQDLSPESEGMYMTFIAELKKYNPYLKVIGFSATPWRTKGGSLLGQENAIFTDIIVEVSQKFLTEEGYLTPLIGKSSVIQANLAGVNITSNGEFNLKKAEAVIDNEKLMIEALEDLEKWAVNRKNFLFFTAGLEHAAHATEILKQKQYNPTLITGKTEKKTLRPKILNDFRNNKFEKKQSLVNNAVLTTGTDLPNVDCIVLWRATASSMLYVQILSRGTRPVYADGYDLNTKEGRLAAIANGPKPNCLVLDYAGNIERFGAIDLIQIPHSKKNKNDKGEPHIAPQKICPACREPNPIVSKYCHCGHEFEFNESLKHSNVASSSAVSSFEIKPERYEVTHVIYKTHISSKGNPCLRVQYYDTFGFICSKYIAFSSPKAKLLTSQWARTHGVNDDINDTNHAFSIRDKFKKPKAIYVKKSGKYMDITRYEF